MRVVQLSEFLVGAGHYSITCILHFPFIRSCVDERLVVSSLRLRVDLSSFLRAVSVGEELLASCFCVLSRTGPREVLMPQRGDVANGASSTAKQGLTCDSQPLSVGLPRIFPLVQTGE